MTEERGGEPFLSSWLPARGGRPLASAAALAYLRANGALQDLRMFEPRGGGRGGGRRRRLHRVQLLREEPALRDAAGGGAAGGAGARPRQDRRRDRRSVGCAAARDRGGAEARLRAAARARDAGAGARGRHAVRRRHDQGDAGRRGSRPGQARRVRGGGRPPDARRQGAAGRRPAGRAWRGVRLVADLWAQVRAAMVPGGRPRSVQRGGGRAALRGAHRRRFLWRGARRRTKGPGSHRSLPAGGRPRLIDVTKPLISNDYSVYPDAAGRFGDYGGRYVAETLMPLVLALETAWREAK